MKAENKISKKQTPRTGRVQKFSVTQLAIICLLAGTFQFRVYPQLRPDSFIQKLECYYSGMEKVYLHTDRVDYVSGDEVFFKGYVVNGLSFKPDTLCKILYIAIKNSNNQVVKFIRVYLAQGSCMGSFPLPDTLSTGNYYITAFTNNMRNFSHELYFKEKILVANLTDENLLSMVTNENDSSGRPNKEKVNSRTDNLYDIKVLLNNDKDIIINIQSVIKNRQSVPLYLICYSGGAPPTGIPIVLAHDSVRVTLPIRRSLLGAIHLCLLNSAMDIVCQRTFLFPVSGDDISVNTDTRVYGPRQKVHVSLDLSPNEQRSGKVSLSASVSRKYPGQAVNPTRVGIQRCLTACSETGDYDNAGFPDSTGSQVIPCDESGPLSGQNIIQGPMPICRSLPETRGYFISGKVIDKANRPLPDVCVYLSAPDSMANLKYDFTDENGRFQFRLSRFYDNKNLIFQARSGDRESRIEIEDKFNGDEILPAIAKQIQPDLRSYLTLSRLVSLVNKIYGFSPGNLSTPAGTYKHQNLPGFYGIPDETIYTSDYAELAGFNEISKNILPGIHYSPNTNRIRVTDLVSHKLFKDDALLFLNNIPFPDPAYISKLNSREIRKIELKKNHLRLGNLDIYGIVSITTTGKDVYAIDPDQSSLVYPNDVSIRDAALFSPEYGDAGALPPTMPDFRQTLYWNPSVEIQNGKGSLEFYTSDISGIFIIDVEGITQDGQPLSGHATIEVTQ